MKNNLSPGPKSQELQAKREKYVARGPYNITPFFAESAQGCIIKDVDGNELLDFAGGIGVLNVGHSPKKVVDALKDQLDKFIHTCYHVVQYDSYVELAKRLTQLTPGDGPKKAMFVNSGAEAVENAVKMAKKYTNKQGVLSFNSAFHGRTLMTMSLTSKVKPYKQGFGPFAPETYKVPYANCYRCAFGAQYPGCGLACVENIEHFFASEASPDQIAAIIAEPVQGEGGFIIPPSDYFKALKQVCTKHNILLIADEVQTGFGRTGKLFAMEHFDVVPDMITMSKSIAAGLPLSAIVGRADVLDAPGPGEIGGTFAGNPLSCVAGLKVLEMIEEESLLARSNEIGKIIERRFREMQDKYNLIGDVRCLGAMCAMELVLDKATKQPAKAATDAIVSKTWQNGLITLSAGVLGNVIRILPPLVVSNEELNRGLDILDKVIAEVQTDYM